MMRLGNAAMVVSRVSAMRTDDVELVVWPRLLLSVSPASARLGRASDWSEARQLGFQP